MYAFFFLLSFMLSHLSCLFLSSFILGFGLCCVLCMMDCCVVIPISNLIVLSTSTSNMEGVLFQRGV